MGDLDSSRQQRPDDRGARARLTRVDGIRGAGARGSVDAVAKPAVGLAGRPAGLGVAADSRVRRLVPIPVHPVADGDAHGWRQIFNADVARNFTEQSLNILYPRVNWGGGGDGVVSMEFPLLQWIAALLFREFGERDIICRLVAMVFSMATIAGIYGLANTVWDRTVARGAAFLLAISPSMIFFGRAFISDTPMVCFSVFGVWGFVSYLLNGRRTAIVWGAVTAALACMTKLPAVVLFAPIVWMAWQTRGFAVLRDRVLLAGLATVFLLTAAWYCHADVLFHRTGLGVAIFHGVGGYSPDVMEGSGTVTLVSSWNTMHQLRDPEFYRTLLERFWTLHFTPVGSIVMLFSAIVLCACRTVASSTHGSLAC